MAACQMTCKLLLPALAAAASAADTSSQDSIHQPSPLVTGQLALSAMLAIVTAAVRVASAPDTKGDTMAGTGSACLHACIDRHREHNKENTSSFSNASSSKHKAGTDADTEMHEEDVAVSGLSLKQLAGGINSQYGVAGSSDPERNELRLLRLQVLTELLAFQQASSPLSKQV